MVFPRGFSGKYLDDDLGTNIYPNTEKAVEVMKKVIDIPDEKYSEVSRKRRRSQKPKKSKKLKKG